MKIFPEKTFLVASRLCKIKKQNSYPMNKTNVQKNILIL